ncbi:DMT family transporter [Kribbella turkmenica]|uniref:DMT family transporter n=1 Tax=Kribbella turkmenica TaxID=2530375 RepID=A0A4R4WJN5_9ACTN|nr:EamA family transporter [Kribbella turkmenica]TDD13860.1 DMT family transporter [Kribbella turkmenica]
MGVALALLSALAFGLSDIAAGIASRRLHSTVVAFVGQLAGVVLTASAALLVAAPSVTWTALGWGALAGVGTGLGAAFLFQAMSVGRFSIVVPLSDVAGVAVPVLIGVALLGDHIGPAAWCGFALSVPALWLITSKAGPRGGSAAGARWALLSGAAFSLQYLALAQADPAAGLWPLVFNRIGAVLSVAPWAARPDRLRMRKGTFGIAVLSGVLGTVAIAAFWFASREQALSIAVVLTSLYPVVPVLAGIAVFHEPVTRRLLLGLGLAALTVVLISL